MYYKLRFLIKKKKLTKFEKYRVGKKRFFIILLFLILFVVFK